MGSRRPGNLKIPLVPDLGEPVYRFGLDLEILYEEWNSAGIRTTNIEKAIADGRAVEAAAAYVVADFPGFEEAVARLRCNKSMEALVTREKYAPLFDDDVLQRAKQKLRAAGC